MTVELISDRPAAKKYSVPYNCGNCGEGSSFSFPFGTVADCRAMPCIHCGVSLNMIAQYRKDLQQRQAMAVPFENRGALIAEGGPE